MRDSNILDHIDLSLVGEHESPDIDPEPQLCEELVVPILDSLVGRGHCNLWYFQKCGKRGEVLFWMHSWKTTTRFWNPKGISVMNAKKSVTRMIHLGLVPLCCLGCRGLSLNFMDCKILFATLVKGMAAMSAL